MHVFLLGATGNLGSRLLPALHVHGHQTTVLVRSQAKLESLVPSSALSETTIITGDATDLSAVCSALITSGCDALINTAGQAAIFPWQSPRKQGIEEIVTRAAVEASKKMGKPLRVWVMGGMTALDYPGMPGTALSRYFPMFTEHGYTFDLMTSLPSDTLHWSMLCPSAMLPESKTVQSLSSPRDNPLTAEIDIPACMSDFHIDWIPFFGPLITILGNAWKYNTTLEDCADFIARDLTKSDSEFVGHRVSVIQLGKTKKD